jgi:transmembrane sensor
MIQNPPRPRRAKTGVTSHSIEVGAHADDCDPRAHLARQEATAWYAKMTGQRVSNQDVAAFFAWRGDTLNDAAYTRIEHLTTSVRAVADDPRLQAIAEAAARRPREGRLRAALAQRPRMVTGLGVAAVAALIAAVVLVHPGQQTYSTSVGERRAISLEDGSTIELNTNSRVRVRLGKARRDLFLDRGQAMFAVAHDAGRPFVVTAGDTAVRAIGTRFEVYRTAGDVRVTLAEGRVQVSTTTATNTPSPPLVLSAGERVDVGTKLQAKPVSVDIAAATGWTNGRLTFRDERLADAVAEINRYSKRPVVLGEGAPPDARVYGVFDAGDTEAFVTGVSAALNLTSAQRADGAFELTSTSVRPG